MRAILLTISLGFLLVACVPTNQFGNQFGQTSNTGIHVDQFGNRVFNPAFANQNFGSNFNPACQNDPFAGGTGIQGCQATAVGGHPGGFAQSNSRFGPNGFLGNNPTLSNFGNNGFGIRPNQFSNNFSRNPNQFSNNFGNSFNGTNFGSNCFGNQLNQFNCNNLNHQSNQPFFFR